MYSVCKQTSCLSLSLQVYVSKEGTAAEYGMLAKDNIEEGEVLFTIPRSALLHQGTTKVSALLERGDGYVNTVLIFAESDCSCVRMYD